MRRDSLRNAKGTTITVAPDATAHNQRYQQIERRRITIGFRTRALLLRDLGFVFSRRTAILPQRGLSSHDESPAM